jgi:hypothetical protein
MIDPTEVAYAAQDRFQDWVVRLIGGGNFSDKPSLKIVVSADCLDASKLNFLCRYLKQFRTMVVVALSTTKLPGELPVIYMKACPWNWRRELALHYGCEPDRVQGVVWQAQGDLRQIRITATSGGIADRADPRRHVHFNTSDFLRGNAVPSEFLHDGGLGWVHENYLKCDGDLEAMANMAETLALLDADSGIVRDPLDLHQPIMSSTLAVNIISGNRNLRLDPPRAILNRPSSSEIRAALDRFSEAAESVQQISADPVQEIPSAAAATTEPVQEILPAAAVATTEPVQEILPAAAAAGSEAVSKAQLAGQLQETISCLSASFDATAKMGEEEIAATAKVWKELHYQRELLLLGNESIVAHPAPPQEPQEPQEPVPHATAIEKAEKCLEVLETVKTVEEILVEHLTQHVEASELEPSAEGAPDCQKTGVHEIDAALFPIVATLGTSAFYQTGADKFCNMTRDRESVDSWASELTPRVGPLTGYHDRRWSVAFLNWEFPRDEVPPLAKLFNQIDRENLLISVGCNLPENGAQTVSIWAYIRKLDKSTLPDGWFDVNGVKPQRYSAPIILSPQANNKKQIAIIEAFSKTFGYGMCNFVFHQGPEKFSDESHLTVEQLSDLTRHLTMHELQNLIANAKIRGGNAVMRALVVGGYRLIQLKQLQEENDVDAKALKSYNLRRQNLKFAFRDSTHFRLFSNEVLTNLSKVKGTRFDETTGEKETITLLQLFTSPSKWMNYASVFLGSDKTSGAGKSVTAYTLAITQAEHLCKKAERPMQEASILRLNAPEDVRHIPYDLRAMIGVVFDEFKPTNGNQAKFVDDDILKIWFDVRYGGDWRANYNNAGFPAGVPRTFTGNASSAEEWLLYGLPKAPFPH